MPRRYYWGDRWRHDQDNPLKLLQDALTGVVWEDDRWVLPQVMDFDVDKQNPRLEIEIEIMG
ncbi:RusA family crossover junction endodeoxyribonuclease [Alicyclobacillus fastidiosus]|uniref:RusA family crossover junction endodeoxyribonuclease n=1 Tax=Alicyclobacillus fastidiosus TaxID=392011 RepID=A0ABV5A9U9_9BACL|nr:RusA family crossover junction endodeoxyribonuclease [Alicyclobacillus fastidiosus]WEH12014.1 RusA family crossover junction endodeoxyribonuclease [Alicyclobacillus fastidiosus]